ncbi:MAG: hypothetical protein KZQ94_04100 [Candidatus Thiodiazotropha sp. (ex Troendleina suluensis)]|nr:hypothetical protein [Candidatus Thiodiazotropha sp. (ex Troendleina suluensis)]
MKNTALRKIVRDDLDPNALYGIVLNESSDYLLIAREYDFFIDGFQILRKQDITSSVTNKSNKYVYKILKSEGKLKSINIPIIDLTNWETIFKSLGKGEFVSVEDEVVGDMAIGPIIRVNKKSMVLRYFDGAGIWRDNENIRYKDITSLQFKTNYINHHAKYIQP